MEPLTLIAGGALLAAGYIAGLFGRRKSRPRDLRPVCECDHGLNYHDPGSGHCHGLVPGPLLSQYSKSGVYLGEEREMSDCTCRRYVGPVALGDVWVPPVLPKEPS